MKNLIEYLKANTKVEKVKTELLPSLGDDLNYESIEVIIKTKRNLFDWAKNIRLVPSGDLFEIEMTCCYDPSKGILKDIYTNHKTKDWDGKSKSHSTNPVINLIGDENLIKSLVTYMYSTLN